MGRTSNDVAAITLERHLAAENAHDADAIARTFAEDGVLVLNGQTFRGRALIRTVHERFGFGAGGSFSDLRIREVHRYTGANAIVLEEEISARHTGVWDGVAPTGRAFTIPVCTVYEFDDAGDLASERVYFDNGGLLKKLQGTA